MANTVCSLCCHIVSEHMSNIGFEGGKGGGGKGLQCLHQPNHITIS